MIDPISPASAASAAPVLAARPSSPSSAASFASYLGSAVSEAVGTLDAGEQAMVAGLKGTAGPQEVVNAVIAAETTLQTVVSLRDKAVSAYNDLLRMPI